MHRRRSVIDQELGIGIDDTAGDVRLTGLPSLSEREREELAHLIGIFKYGLWPEDERETGDRLPVVTARQ